VYSISIKKKITLGKNENIQWQPISNSLKEIYKEQNILHHFEEDESYLKNAFEVTEKLWKEQFNKIDKLKIIMISGVFKILCQPDII